MRFGYLFLVGLGPHRGTAIAFFVLRPQQTAREGAGCFCCCRRRRRRHCCCWVEGGSAAATGVGGSCLELLHPTHRCAAGTYSPSVAANSFAQPERCLALRTIELRSIESTESVIWVVTNFEFTPKPSNHVKPEQHCRAALRHPIHDDGCADADGVASGRCQQRQDQIGGHLQHEQGREERQSGLYHHCLSEILNPCAVSARGLLL
jgi:hypothetical protein